MRPPIGAGDQRHDASSDLLALARRGNRAAIAALAIRVLPRLHRWARGRVPKWAGAAVATSDIVQDAVIGALRRLDRFQPRGHGALRAYLREAVRNRIRDEHRRLVRRGVPRGLPLDLEDARPSPLDVLIADEERARYRAALGRLPRRDRELIVAHIDLEYSHEQLACMIGHSRNAARMALHRAIERLAREMRRS